MTQNDQKLRDIQKAIAGLEEAKKKRMAQLSDPKRKEIFGLWEELRAIVQKLDALGEYVVDLNGDALYIDGTMFSLSSSGEIIEH